jgi:hypothetical protein
VSHNPQFWHVQHFKLENTWGASETSPSTFSLSTADLTLDPKAVNTKTKRLDVKMKMG